MKATTIARRNGDARLRRRVQPPSAYPLGDLRRARGLTQAELASRLAVSQATVSKLEKGRPGVATVRRYVTALGGELELVAVFDADRMILEC